MKNATVRDHLPFKQGLRLILSKNTFKLMSVRDHLPLKQGLRPTIDHTSDKKVAVRDHLPLKQGLRLLGTLMTLTLVSTSETIFHSNKD